MDERTLLLDSDIFIVLAASGLLKTVLDQLAFNVDSTYRLDALPYMLYGKRLRRAYPLDILDRAFEWTERIDSVTREPSSDAADRMLPSGTRGGTLPFKRLMQSCYRLSWRIPAITWPQGIRRLC